MGCCGSKDTSNDNVPEISHLSRNDHAKQEQQQGSSSLSSASASASASALQQKQNQQHPNERKGNNFSDQYQLGKMIGSGTFSVVREAYHKETNQKYAIKCIKREGLTAEDIEALTAEVEILKLMNHPNILILHDFFTEDNYYYLVTEFMEGGELFDRIVEKSYYTESEARDLVKLLLQAIKYCHACNVVHRDLKPENLLLTSQSDDASIKLADFGFAKKIEFYGEGLSTACGTPGYVAPEILQGKTYGCSVDIWSIGVITYILLCGYPPFHDDNHNALFRKIKKGKYHFDSPYWDHISDSAKDLITKMLVSDPAKRATATELLEHQWVVEKDVATIHLTSALEELRRFNIRRKFKAAVNTIKAANALNKKLNFGAISAENMAGLEKAASEAKQEHDKMVVSTTDAVVVAPVQAEESVTKDTAQVDEIVAVPKENDASAPVEDPVETFTEEIAEAKDVKDVKTEISSEQETVIQVDEKKSEEDLHASSTDVEIAMDETRPMI